MSRPNSGGYCMNDSYINLKIELQLNARVVVIIIIFLDLLFILTINPALSSARQLKELFQGVLIQVMLLVAWKFENLKPLIARWLIIIALIVLIFSINNRYYHPALLSLLVVPVSLSAVLISISAATAISIGQTFLLVALYFFFDRNDMAITIVTCLVLIWVTFCIMNVIYNSINNITYWVWKRYNYSYVVLKDAQEDRVKLKQALDDLVHANRQLTLFNKRISEYRLIAEDALQAKSDFVARVSHEFRTPLNIIIGLIELMVETPEIYDVMPSPKMYHDLQVVYHNSEHLAKMINDILDLTRTEAGQLTIHRERQDLSKIIESAMIAVRPLLENKKLNWSVSAPDYLPNVYCDGIRIEQVILNLVSNAIRHTNQGGISVNVNYMEQHIWLSVVDTGSGISPEDVKRIFEPFNQGKEQFGPAKGGSGLGLSISKHIVELHNGRMWVESKLGVGSTFTFELPIEAPIPPIAKPGHQIIQNLVWGTRDKTRIQFPDSHYKPRIVILDEKSTLYNMFAHFSDEIEFINTANLNQAINALKQSPAHAVILNMFSQKNVFQSLEIIKKQMPGTPIIACSIPTEIDYTHNYGVLGYLIKPVTRSDLIRSIQAIGKPIKRILIVDDDPTVQEIFQRILSMYDNTLEVKAVSNGKQVLNVLRNSRPDLMLLDIVLPDMDGWQILKAIKQDQNIRYIPTLIVSAQDPRGKPPSSPYLLATMDKDLSINKLLNCSLDLSALFLNPEGRLGLMPEEIVEISPVSTNTEQRQEKAPELHL